MMPGHDCLQFMGCGGKMDYYWCSTCKKAVEPMEVQDGDEVFLCCPNCFIDDLGVDTIPELGEAILDPEEEEDEPSGQVATDPEVEVTLERPWDESVDTSSDEEPEADDAPIVQENQPIYDFT